MSLRIRAALAASLALACALPAAAGAASLYSGPGPRPGPDVLYAGPVDAPQLQNTGIWQAPPILVSGATAYRDGEFLYQDFLYDDLGANNAAPYPADPRYAGNAADLVELRLKPVGGELAVRLTYNSMADPAVVATTIALGDSPVALPLPFGAPARMPAEVFVTYHAGTTAATDAATGQIVASGLTTAVDGTRRQVEIRIPANVLKGAGRKALRVGAVTGTWNPAGRYDALYNVAFRTAEPPSAWRSDAQAAALADGDLSRFSATVDLTKLAAGDDDESGVPKTGFLDRIFASAFEERQGRGDAVSRRPGCDAPCALQYSGRLQPYAVYVPPGPAPAGGWGLTLDLHGCTQTYNIGFGSRRQQQLGARGRGSIVLTPEARGDCYWYFGEAGADVFEAWADVARHYALDPDRTAILGSSMGGYGAYKLAAAYPDLFARTAGVVPCPGAGIEWTGVRTVPGGTARSLEPLLPSLRHVPVMSWQSTGDSTCRYDRQIALLARLQALGYRYSSLTFDGIDHRTLATAALSDAGPLADFLGDARIDRDPARVTYVFNPAVSEPTHGLAADHAYWISDVLPYSFRAPGRVDVTSAGIGERDPGPPAAARSAGALSSGLAFVEESHLGGAAERAPSAARLLVSNQGIRSITVDAERARTGCSPTVSTTSYELLKIRLAGCNKTYAVKRVCHTTPVFDVLVRAPPGERPESLSVTLAGRPIPVHRRKARLNVRRMPHAVARVRVVSVDRGGRTHVRAAAHRWCPAR